MGTQAMSMVEIEELINSTIIARLKENNIFEGIISVEEVRFLLLSKIKGVAYKDLSDKGLGGEWDPNTQIIYFDEKTVSERLVIHELLHVLTTECLKANSLNVGIQYNENIYKEGEMVEYFESGRGLNEGLTEYLAQQLCPDNTYQVASFGIGFSISGGYHFEQIMVKQLAILYGEKSIKSAYINHNQASMRFLIGPTYDEVNTNFDHIFEQETAIRNILQGKTFQMLSPEEREVILRVNKNVVATFIGNQQFFLENCLQSMIDSVNTLEEAEELAAKIRQLNLTGLTIANNEKANYEIYNFMFVRKYLQIINQNRVYEEQVRFDDVEQYLTGDTKIGELPHEPLQTNITQPNSGFAAIDRGEEGTIYIRKLGLEKIGGIPIDALEYFTEEEFKEYNEGRENVQGTILRGFIIFDLLNQEGEYRQAVLTKLLSRDNLEDRIKKHNGYIGHISNGYIPFTNPDVEKRLVDQRNIQSDGNMPPPEKTPDKKQSRINVASISR